VYIRVYTTVHHPEVDPSGERLLAVICRERRARADGPGAEGEGGDAGGTQGPFGMTILI
jgi:hypothetical protein